jgi:hypothetical protein
LATGFVVFAGGFAKKWLVDVVFFGQHVVESLVKAGH